MDTTDTHSSELAYGLALNPTVRLLYSGSRGVVSAAPTVLAVGRTSLGRDPGAGSQSAISLPSDHRASRSHAWLHRQGQAVRLVDEGSKNGTFVNGRRVSAAVLEDGDVVRIGDSFLIYRLEAAPAGAPQDASLSSVVGVSPVARALRQRLTALATERTTVLLLGESGTGKEVAARALHELSRRLGPFIAVNCGALPSELAESLLFGHIAGAYSGAQKAQAGFFRAADRGTLLLDEIGDLPLALQPKLLRVLEERAVTPVGATAPIACDVRIVAATHRELVRAVKMQEFRGDLYARLAEVPLPLAPLRERREDILPLFLHAVADPAARLTPRLVAALLNHSFPFNVRELFKLASQLRVDTPAGQPYDLGPIAARLDELGPAAASADSRPAGESLISSISPPPRLPAPSREELVALLLRHGGNISSVARAMGRSRRQIDRWLEGAELDVSQFRS